MVLSKTKSARSPPPSQAEKITFPQRAVLHRFPAPPGGLLQQKEAANAAEPQPGTPDPRRQPAQGENARRFGLPFMADMKDGTSYAPWKVWSESSTRQRPYVPLARGTFSCAKGSRTDLPQGHQVERQRQAHRAERRANWQPRSLGPGTRCCFISLITRRAAWTLHTRPSSAKTRLSRQTVAKALAPQRTRHPQLEPAMRTRYERIRRFHPAADNKRIRDLATHTVAWLHRPGHSRAAVPKHTGSYPAPCSLSLSRHAREAIDRR